MSENIDTIKAQLWEKMRDKPYRDTFVAAHLSTNIVAQIQTLREQRGWTKRLLAQKTGMSPSRISVMEDPSYDKFTLSTLKRLASAFDVAFIARFAPFSELASWVADLSPEKLEVPAFDEDKLERQEIADMGAIKGGPAPTEQKLQHYFSSWNWQFTGFGLGQYPTQPPAIAQNQSVQPANLFFAGGHA